MNQVNPIETPNAEWKKLYKIGGLAALMAGIFFRRNIAAEISLFSAYQAPSDVGEWFALLQSNRLLGLAYLNVFDLVNYILVGLMFLALFVVLKQANPAFMTIAIAFCFLGIAAYFASNTAFSMLALSAHYAAATTDAQKTVLLSAGEALLALNRFSNADAAPGTAGLASLFLIAAAGMLASITMLQSNVFRRTAAYVGIVASALDLAYCFAFVLNTSVDGKVLALVFIPAAGLFWMIWQILVGWRLWQLGNLSPHRSNDETVF